MKNDFLTTVENTIEKFGMINKDDRLLVCLSGGADSVTLLLSLYKLEYNVKAIHINHCLRGKESDRDENFCRDLCQKLGIELTVRKINVTDFCEKNSYSTEEGARILRYRAFEEQDCDKICTAHNLNDCLETTLFNLARGTGIKGLASIPPVRGKIIRPLIEVSREEIEEFLKENQQDFVTDSTNLQTEYSRNKIRHKVIPELEKINSSLFKTYAKTVDNLREDCFFLEKLGRDFFQKAKNNEGYDSKYVLNLDNSVKNRVIINILKEQNVEISTEKITALENLMQNGGKLNISAGLFAVCKNDLLKFIHICEENSFDYSPEKIVMGENFWGKRRIFFNLEKNFKYNENVHKKFANCCLDYAKIKGEIVLRQRAEGEKIRLVNRDFQSDLRKLINKEFSKEDRKDAVIIADDEGVIFVEKYGVADRVKIDENTRTILTFSIEK